MPIAVRRATGEDVGALTHLNGAVQELHARLYPGDFKPVVAQPDVRKFFSGLLGKPDSFIGIAQVGLSPLGYVWFDLQSRPESPLGYVWFDLQSRPETPFTPARRRVYLHHISVVPEAHRRGIGSVLMNYVEQRAVLEAAV